MNVGETQPADQSASHKAQYQVERRRPFVYVALTVARGVMPDVAIAMVTGLVVYLAFVICHSLGQAGAEAVTVRPVADRHLESYPVLLCEDR